MIDVEHFRVRVTQDAMTETLRAHWLRRAEDFERARPRRSDFTGRVTQAELLERDARLAAIALACRRRALLALGERLSPEDEALLRGAA